MSVTASAAAAAAAHRRVKRAMGLLRGAAQALAPLADELDLVGEVHLQQGQTDLTELQDVLRVARHRHGALDVVILAAPRTVDASLVDATRPADRAPAARDA